MLAFGSAGCARHTFWTYVGSNVGTGIALFKLDTKAGTLTSHGMAVEANMPGFLAVAPNQERLYAGVRKAGATTRVSAVEGFAINAKTGKLKPLNEQPSGGEEVTHLNFDPSGRNVMAVHYSVSTISVLPINSDGTLRPATNTITQVGSSINPQRQNTAHAHSINTDPAGKFALVCDLGADKIFTYHLDADAGKLTPNDPPAVSVMPGSGPRHLTFHPNGKWVYVLNEMGATVIAYDYDPTNAGLKALQTSKTLPEDFKGNNTSAEVQIDPSGRYLYASNRGDSNFLTIFSIDQATGRLTLVGYQPSLGRIPRNFRIDPTGQFMVVANQESGTIVLFKIDQLTGKLTPVGTPMPTIKGPLCVKFVAAD
jgi:6-phosphogluconolactonase